MRVRACLGRAASVLLQLGVLAFSRLAAQCPDGTPPPCAAPAARAPTPAPPPNSVAVLYFENLSPDTVDDYLADGLTEEITDRLGAIERLQVKSRSAVRLAQSAAPGGDPTTLGRTLQVRQLVEGSVRRAGPRVRVSVRLVRTSDGFRVWGAVFDRAAADLLAIEEDIARQVATAIGGRLLPAERAALAARPTQDAQAYDDFLRGNYYLAQRSPRAARRAFEAYESAARRDPAYVRALARIAFTYGAFLTRGWPYPGVEPDTLLARGLALADSALRLDSTAADAWLSRGVLLRMREPRTFAGAREALQRATELNPRDSEALSHYGVTLLWLGEDSAADRIHQRALALDPANFVAMLGIAHGAFIGRRYEEARRWMDSVLAVDPGFHDAYARRAVYSVYLGDTAGARQDAETALRVAAGERALEQAVLAQLAARAGDTATARRLVNAMIAEAPRGSGSSLDHARAAAAALVALRDAEGALAVLERARPRGVQLWFYLRFPDFDALRDQPRFQRLVEESRPR